MSLFPLQSNIEHETDVGYLGASQVLEDRDEIEQLIVVGVAEPTADGHRMLWVEDITRRRVVDDDGLLKITPDLTQILDIVALVVITALPEEPMMHDLMNIQLVEEGVAVFGHRCGEHYDLVNLAHAFEKGIHARPFYDVDVVILTFNLNGDREICLVEDL
jgi:hypothetical protein